jgi:hypothetical protein
LEYNVSPKTFIDHPVYDLLKNKTLFDVCLALALVEFCWFMDSLGYVSQVIQLTDSTVYIIGKHTLQ